MAVKQKADWRAVSIPGSKEAYVAVVDGKEVGTIARYDRKSAWTVYRGIGQHAKLVGTSYAKEGAKFLLLAP